MKTDLRRWMTLCEAMDIWLKLIEAVQVVHTKYGPFLINPSTDDLAALFDYVAHTRHVPATDDVTLRFVIDSAMNAVVGSGYDMLHQDMLVALPSSTKIKPPVINSGMLSGRRGKPDAEHPYRVDPYAVRLSNFGASDIEQGRRGNAEIGSTLKAALGTRLAGTNANAEPGVLGPDGVRSR